MYWSTENMKQIVALVFALNIMSIVNAQDKFITKEGFISFFSHTLVEDIKADNNQVLSIIDTQNGEIAIQLLMRSFQFKKALMQEHFNESYVESHKFPKATFRGVVVNYNELEGENAETEIKGTLTIHGKSKEITIIARINTTASLIKISGDFTVEVADFDIQIPAVVRNNIAKTIKITFDLDHKPYLK